ncbi:hypothetical protein GPL02_04910 [Clostridium sp. MCC334]|nr:hypothetical protein [Clostridium sp. MCC334]
MEGTVFSSKTAEAKSLITELMGKKAEVDRKELSEYIREHSSEEFTDGVIAGAIKIMVASGEIVVVRRGVYQKGIDKLASTRFERIFNMCQRFKTELTKVCTFSMMELTDSEKEAYPKMAEIIDGLRKNVDMSVMEVDSLINELDSGSKKPDTVIPEEKETLIKNEDAFNPQTAIEGLGISLGVISMDDLKEKDDTASVLETVIEGESDIAPLVPVTKKRGRKSVEK